MIKYKCGHKTDMVIILDNNELSIIKYLEWVESVGLFGNKEKCFDCFIKEKKDG